MRFSPHGTYVAIGETTGPISGPSSSSRMGYALDAAGATITYLTDPLPVAAPPGSPFIASFTFPATWR